MYAGDLYAGARDALMLLSDRIRPGTVIVFDDLVNYNNYREHEVKALYEWLQVGACIDACLALPGTPDVTTLHKMFTM